jgi:membrane dipeptidase
MNRQARELLRRAFVWDAHSGFMPEPTADLSNLDLWRDVGVDHLSINVGFDLLPWDHTLRTLEVFRQWLMGQGDKFVLAGTMQDLRRARNEGKMAVSFDIEGMNALDGRLEMVEIYHRLGVRQMLFAYNRNNLAGGGCHDEDGGLTTFGRAVIEEMNRLGMFVDLSHCGYRTCLEAMACSTQPVIFSHSNPRELSNHERNITNEQIQACAATGGIVGVVGVDLLLGARTLADHVCYLLDLAGPRHVGIGLDYAFPVDAPYAQEIIHANPDFWPPDRGYAVSTVNYTAPAQLLELTDVLSRRGHSEEVVSGVLGENFLRLAAELWK